MNPFLQPFTLPRKPEYQWSWSNIDPWGFGYPEEIYRIVDSRSSAGLTAANNDYFELPSPWGDDDYERNKQTVSDHLLWTSYQPLSPLLSASHSFSGTLAAAKRRCDRGNGNVRIYTIDVKKLCEHGSELWPMQLLVWYYDATVPSNAAIGKEWAISYNVPTEAVLSVDTILEFETGGNGGISVLSFLG
ncbi:hypothetical protein MMC13_003001 [Lambiella insularis]|nr:hypothetical protein [Lambiella insularis]